MAAKAKLIVTGDREQLRCIETHQGIATVTAREIVDRIELAAVHADLAKRLAELEQKTEGLALTHDTFSRNTGIQLKQLLEAVNQLMEPPDPPKRPIGFNDPEERSKKTASRG